MYRDYADKVDQIVQLTSDNATLDATIAVNEATIASAKKRERQNEIDRQEFDASNARAETKKNQLKEIFQDQDLEMQALADAVEIEQRINDVTYDLFRSIECSTDSLCD